jgi:hypothetical protein
MVEQQPNIFLGKVYDCLSETEHHLKANKRVSFEFLLHLAATISGALTQKLSKLDLP